MTIIAVVGGKLQGTEAVYLARKAGFSTLLIDKNPEAPASGLCDAFLTHDFLAASEYPRVEKRPDFILPAIEDDRVLARVQAWAAAEGIPLAFDPRAYGISSSKRRSDALFDKLGLPMPLSWPRADFPLVVKPDQASGSQGVEIFRSRAEFEEKFPDDSGRSGLVIQEYLDGPSYSIEIIGKPGRYHTLQVTDLGMDAAYDCNRVAAPTRLAPDRINAFRAMAEKLAEALQLKGIMDLEVILNRGELKLLEIDARFPSQTPMAVYWSTGINMVAMLADLVLDRLEAPAFRNETPVIVEHIRVTGEKVDCLGEHIMGSRGPLHLEKDFFGADEAITSFSQGASSWVATLVITGKSREDVMHRHGKCIKEIETWIRAT